MKVQAQRGFSLLELLVALFVVVIVTSLVTLSVNSGGQDIQLQAKVRSLADISAYALDEAQMRGVDMGLLLEKIDEGGESRYRYSWRERKPRGWQRPDVEADLYANQKLPAGVELTLELENVVVDLSDKSLLAPQTSGVDKSVAVDVPVPQVIFYSSGEVTEGAIILRDRDTGDVLWRIEWDLLGRFTLLRRGEVDDDEPQ